MYAMAHVIIICLFFFAREGVKFAVRIFEMQATPLKPQELHTQLEGLQSDIGIAFGKKHW